jgi:hypothetical protein
MVAEGNAKNLHEAALFHSQCQKTKLSFKEHFIVVPLKVCTK